MIGKKNSGGSFQKRIDQILQGNELGCEIVLVAMMVLITVEVVSRTLFNFSTQLADEVSGYLLVAVTFLGIGISLREGALFRVDMLYARFSARLKERIELFFNLLSLAFILLAEYQILRFLVSSIERGVTAPTLLGTPLYLPQLVMPIGLGIVILVLFAEIRGTFHGLRKKGSI